MKTQKKLLYFLSFFILTIVTNQNSDDILPVKKDNYSEPKIDCI